MEKDKMNITHQDIIDKEFRVKFRGFDIAEVATVDAKQREEGRRGVTGDG